MLYVRLFNILCAGNKLSMQRGFFKNSAGNILAALKFLGRLYNFLQLCNFIFCNVSHNDKQKSNIFYRFRNNQILPKNMQLK